MLKRICIAILFAVLPVGAFAATIIGPNTGSGAYYAQTIGTSSITILNANTAHVFLDIFNASSTATIACAFGSTVAAVNGAGSYTIPAEWHRSWEGTFVPTDSMNCISSAPSTPITIGVY